MEGRRPPRRKNQKPITGEIFYPTTEEGKRIFIDSSTPVVIDILEKQLGPKRLSILMEHYKRRLQKA
ncbi:hypothetical protein [Clostridium beijerinckii]|uniref:Uncharacterized protein n=1 Tax=Clostridium beijerinckii TaxID=1520 RepID=A0AAX0AZK7_CLOBE|nr:hypothetical protein [Clostridium beijerinckii]NRT88137.1 hypothetical protein [Clostridium beijerinckii]NYC73565.1 hypothetical protein [Clostridium beijerinckii]